MKKNMLFLILILLLVNIVSAQTILYSEKFRLDTSQEPTQIVIPIKIKNAVDLYGIKIDVEYDPLVMTFSDVEANDFLLEGGVSLITNNVLEAEKSDILETSSGLVKNIIILRSAVESGVSGDGHILNLYFNKLIDSISDITLSNVQLSDADANPILFDVYYLKTEEPILSENRSSVKFSVELKNYNQEPVNEICKITINQKENLMIFESGKHNYNLVLDSNADLTYKFNCAGFVEYSSTYDTPQSVVIDQVVLANNKNILNEKDQFDSKNSLQESTNTHEINIKKTLSNTPINNTQINNTLIFYLIFVIFTILSIIFTIIVIIKKPPKKKYIKNQEIENYIQTHLKNGHQWRDIKPLLINAGWDEKHIEEIYKSIK